MRSEPLDYECTVNAERSYLEVLESVVLMSSFSPLSFADVVEV